MFIEKLGILRKTQHKKYYFEVSTSSEGFMKGLLFGLLLLGSFSILAQEDSKYRDTIGLCEASNKNYNCVIALHFNIERTKVSGHYKCVLRDSGNVYISSAINSDHAEIKDILIDTGKIKTKGSLFGLMLSKQDRREMKKYKYEVRSKGISYKDENFEFEVAQGYNSMDVTGFISTLHEFDMLTATTIPVELNTICHFAF
jgi:hypothetical protein